MIKGLDHVTILVNDLPGAIAQYKKLLNKDIRPPEPVQTAQPRTIRGFKGAVFSFGTTNIEIITPTDDNGPWARRLKTYGNGLYLVCLKVDNLRETVEELRGKGVRLVDDPGPGTEPITDRLVCIHPASACGAMILLLER